MPIVTRQRPLPLKSYIGRGPIGLYHDIIGAWIESHKAEVTQWILDEIQPNIADFIPDGSITGDKIADGAIGIANLESGLASFFQHHVVGYATVGIAETI